MDERQVHSTMGAALVEYGVMTADAVAANLAQLETPLNGNAIAPQETTAPTHEAAQPAAQEAVVDPLEAAIWAAPQSVAEYQFAPVPAGQNHDLAFDSANRAALLAAGVPASVGSHMATLWAEAMTKPSPTAAEIELSGRQCMVALTKQWGADTQINIALARQQVVKMAEHQPKIKEMLEATALGNNPWIVTTLANMARARGGRA